jgi:hypothetical protein
LLLTPEINCDCVRGMKRSLRPPDVLRPYGHGKILYLYLLWIAMYIFGLGGALAVYDGIFHLRHPDSMLMLDELCCPRARGLCKFYSWTISYGFLP